MLSRACVDGTVGGLRHLGHGVAGGVERAVDLRRAAAQVGQARLHVDAPDHRPV
jgi:hypothetical protein